jgi:acetyl esterase/lipase
MAEQQTGRVTVERDIVFGTGGGRDLRCNVYHPPQSGTDRPGVLLIHGGAWVTGDRDQLHGYGILLGRLGYVCVATEYRLAGESKWPAQIHDAKAALRWMRANAGKLGVDPQKIAVSGNSAGAHLSLMLAGTPNLPEFDGAGGNPGVPTDVAACIAFYGPALLYRPAADDSSGAQPRSETMKMLFGDGYTTDAARKASPLEYTRAGFPPTLLITGNNDETVSAASSFRLYEALIAAGVPAELHVYSEMPHAFDAIPDFGRQCASIMTLFLDRYVANPRTVTRETVAGRRAEQAQALAAGQP